MSLSVLLDYRPEDNKEHSFEVCRYIISSCCHRNYDYLMRQQWVGNLTVLRCVNIVFAAIRHRNCFYLCTPRSQRREESLTAQRHCSVRHIYMSRVARKPDFCLCENKGADQLRSNCEADQRLCFRYTDSTISLLLKSEISSFLSASVTVQADFCGTWSETPKTGFLASWLI